MTWMIMIIVDNDDYLVAGNVVGCLDCHNMPHNSILPYWHHCGWRQWHLASSGNQRWQQCSVRFNQPWLSPYLILSNHIIWTYNKYEEWIVKNQGAAVSINLELLSNFIFYKEEIKQLQWRTQSKLT